VKCTWMFSDAATRRPELVLVLSTTPTHSKGTPSDLAMPFCMPFLTWESITKPIAVTFAGNTISSWRLPRICDGIVVVVDVFVDVDVVVLEVLVVIVVDVVVVVLVVLVTIVFMLSAFARTICWKLERHWSTQLERLLTLRPCCK